MGFFQDALAGRGLPPAVLVPWLDFLARPDALADALQSADALRIESPGKSFPVERELIARGAEADDALLGAAERIDAAAARALEPDKGRIRCLRQHHLGFLAALDDVARLADPGLKLMSPPAAIALMFDKPRCHAALEAAGVAVPRALDAGVGSWEQLRVAMDAAGLRRVFVKPSHASSASGVVALATRPPGPAGPRGALVARTTVELVREGQQVKLYNSRRVRAYTDEADVRVMVDALAREGVQVEEWLPKASLGGKACDLRLVVVGGRASHAVVRTSDSPLTNLHLLNPRGDLEAFTRLLGPERWAALRRLGERAVDAVGAAAAGAQQDGAPPVYAGVDLLVTRGLKRQAVLEVNAFGDLLPRVMVDGRDTYAAEVDALLEAA